MTIVAPLVPDLTIAQRLASGVVDVTRRVEIYDADGSLWFADPALVAGTVSVDISRDERRTLDITLWDDTGMLEIDPAALWYDKQIVPYRGISWPGGSWEVPLGRFMIDTVQDVHRLKRRPRQRANQVGPRPTTDNRDFSLAVQITGRDLTKQMLLAKITRTTTYRAGTALDVFVRAMYANAGFGTVVLPWGPGDTIPVFTTDQTFDPNTSRQEMVKTVLSSFGYENYFDAYAVPHVRAFPDPATMAPAYTFTTGEPDGNLASYVRKSDDSQLFNRVVVTNESTGSTTSGFFYGEASITDPNSPVHSSKIGDRLMPPIKISTATSDADCVALAESFLKVAALEAFEVDMGSVVLPQAEGGDVVTFVDPDAAKSNLEPQNYLLTSFEISMGLGPMNSIGKRLVIVS